jgi:2-hydroxychromene-2-carboxylate isomerase
MLVWYFDFISPFAYLQIEAYRMLFRDRSPKLKPLLLAGLLDHWQHKGPAEIPEKRRFTYRYVHWLATSRGIPFSFPPAHPFNPIRPLRLALALGASYDIVLEIFRFIWQEGRLLDDQANWLELCAKLGVADPERVIADPTVKQALRANGEQAIAQGVFGVPTFIAGSELFWGLDATPMLLAYLDDPRLLATAEMQRLDSLPAAANR